MAAVLVARPVAEVLMPEATEEDTALPETSELEAGTLLLAGA